MIGSEHAIRELVGESVTSNVGRLRKLVTDALVATGAFGEVTIDDLAWVDRVSVADVVRRLASHSSHRLLDEQTSGSIDDALRAELGDPDDVLELAYGTEVFVAQRI